MVGPDTGQPRWVVVIPHEQKELYERLRQSLKAGAPFHVILERRRDDRRRGGSRTPDADRRRSDRRQHRPVGALFVATIVRADGFPPAGLAGGESTVVSAACPACYVMVTFELPRFPKPPARLDAELVHRQASTTPRSRRSRCRDGRSWSSESRRSDASRRPEGAGRQRAGERHRRRLVRTGAA